MVNVEEWAEVRRLHRVEGLSIRAIGRKLGLARNTVREVLRSEGPPEYRRAAGPSKLDPFKGRIAELLAEYPASVGGAGARDPERRGLHGREHDPSRLSAPGSSAADPSLPAHGVPAGRDRPGRLGQDARSRSRMPIGKLQAGLRLGHGPGLQPDADRGLLLPHAAGGFPEMPCRSPGLLRWELLAPSCTTTSSRWSCPGAGAEVTFNPQFLPFADRYGFRPWPTWPGEPHEKGLVERPILYIKNNFWAGRKFTGLEDLQGQGHDWRDGICNVRIHSGSRRAPDRSV